MSVTVIFDLNVQAEAVEGLKTTIGEMLGETRTYDGNINVELYQNQDDPNGLTLIEVWETRAKHEAYLAWRTETGLMDTLGKILAGPPSIRYFDQIAT